MFEKNNGEEKKQSVVGKIVKFGLIGFAVLMVIGMFSGEPEEIVSENPEAVKEADTENNTQESAVENPEEELLDHILKATAKDASDLTGTYVDEEAQEQIVIIQTDAGVTYSYGVVDDTEPIIEKDCVLDNTGFGGMLYGVGKNMDGSLCITSGVGGFWGSFVKVSDEAVIDMSAYVAAEDIMDMPEDEDVYVDDNVNSQLKELRSKANISSCATDFYTEEVEWNESTQTVMQDDGYYFDEIALGVWFDEYGNPKADRLPKGLTGGAILDYNLSHEIGVAGAIEQFHFINSEDYTMDMLKRSVVQNDSYADLYAFVIPDIVKIDTYAISGLEYTSLSPVVVHHNFSGILNGDNVLILARYTGLASDDTPNFEAVYAENLNSRF